MTFEVRQHNSIYLVGFQTTPNPNQPHNNISIIKRALVRYTLLINLQFRIISQHTQTQKRRLNGI